MLATGIVPTEARVAASTMNPEPVTPAAPFDVSSVERRAINKDALQARLGLAPDRGALLVVEGPQHHVDC